MYFCSGFIILKQIDSLSNTMRRVVEKVSLSLIDEAYAGAETALTYNSASGMLNLNIFAYLNSKQSFEKNLDTLCTELMNLGFTDLAGVLYCYDPERFPDAMYTFSLNGMEMRSDGLFIRMDPFFSPLSKKLGSQRLF